MRAVIRWCHMVVWSDSKGKKIRELGYNQRGLWARRSEFLDKPWRIYKNRYTGIPANHIENPLYSLALWNILCVLSMPCAFTSLDCLMLLFLPKIHLFSCLPRKCPFILQNLAGVVLHLISSPGLFCASNKIKCCLTYYTSHCILNYSSNKC